MAQEGMANEDSDQDDGPPAKKSRTGTLRLDSDEAAFASTMRPIRPTMPRYERMNIDSDNEDGPADVDDQQSDQSETGDADVDMAHGNENAEDDDVEGVGFQDNGVCVYFFSEVLDSLYMFRCQF